MLYSWRISKVESCDNVTPNKGCVLETFYVSLVSCPNYSPTNYSYWLSLRGETGRHIQRKRKREEGSLPFQLHNNFFSSNSSTSPNLSQDKFKYLVAVESNTILNLYLGNVNINHYHFTQVWTDVARDLGYCSREYSSLFLRLSKKCKSLHRHLRVPLRLGGEGGSWLSLWDRVGQQLPPTRLLERL